MVIQVLFIVTMFLWFLTILPVQQMAPFSWASSILAFRRGVVARPPAVSTLLGRFGRRHDAKCGPGTGRRREPR